MGKLRQLSLTEESEVPAQLSDYIPPTVTMDTDKHINPHVLTVRPLIIIRGPNNNTVKYLVQSYMTVWVSHCSGKISMQKCMLQLQCKKCESK